MKVAKPKRSSPLVAVAFLLLALGLLGGATWYALSQNEQYTEVRDQLAEIESQARRVDTLESRWNSISDQAETIERAFVRRDQLASFLEVVEETAANAGVFEQTSIFAEEPDEITLRLRVSGPYQGIYTFVTHLNVLPNLLFLERVEFFQGSVAVPSGTPSEAVAGYSSAEVIVRVPLKVNPDAGTVIPEL